jgi:plastocyanin
MLRILSINAIAATIALNSLTTFSALTPPKPRSGEGEDFAHRASHLAPRAPGAIRGRVDVPAPARPPDMRPDPAGLGMSGTRDPLDRRRSVVYLETAPRAAFEASPDRRATMSQRNERFVPHVLAMVAGTYVDFPNDDRTYHNVFSLSKNNDFNLGRYAAGHTKTVRFQSPGVVRVFCEIHSHMSAFILVFAHRFFAVTDDEGRYRLEGVPPGTYTLAVWNETVRGDPPRRTVTVGDAGGDVEVDFSIK